jgi:polar amino acid transport system permease protein
MPNIFDLKLVFTEIPALLKYLPVTLEIASISIFFGLLIGLLIAMIKIRKVRVLSGLATLYVSFIRGTPLLIQLYLSFYGIPILLRYINYYYGTNYNLNNVPAMVFVLVAFAMNESAYNSESIRAAIQSVEKGQIEAAHSLGMTSFQTLRRIILPEALIVAIPTLGNSLISLIKGTSLAFAASVVEMTAQAKILAGNNYRYFEMFVSLAIIYWLLTVLIERGIVSLEKKLRASDRGHAKIDRN